MSQMIENEKRVNMKTQIQKNVNPHKPNKLTDTKQNTRKIHQRKASENIAPLSSLQKIPYSLKRYLH